MRLLTFVRKPARRPRPPWSRPQLEQLEDHWCPSASYNVIALPALPGGGANRAFAINASGQVVGTSSGHAVLWQNNGTEVHDLGGSPGGSGYIASGINDFGQIVGTESTADAPQHAFLWIPEVPNGTSGSMIDLTPSLNNSRSDAYAINSAGQVVGAEGGVLAFVYEGGTAYDLNDIYPTTPGGWSHFYEARGINDNHQIVGMGTLISGEEHAFLLTDDDGVFHNGGGTFTDLGGSFAEAVNNSGQAAGYMWVPDDPRYNAGSHGFYWSSGTMTDLGALSGGLYSHALALNNATTGPNAHPVQVIGGSSTKNSPTPEGYQTRNASAFLWQPGHGGMTDLNRQISASSGWTLHEARGINDAGWIVGVGGLNGQERAFLLQPAGAALTAAAAAPNPVRQVLTPAAVRPLLAEAVARWAAAGANTAALRGVSVLIADLPGAELGEAAGQTVSLDANAAGWGWFIDPTPRGDSEFTTPGNQGEQQRMDLLTVLEHELGHVLGYEHSRAGVMLDALPPGTRRTPRSAVSLSDPVGRDWASLATALDTTRPKQRQS
jgi:probable HAF family extracellular repeat protein